MIKHLFQYLQIIYHMYIHTSSLSLQPVHTIIATLLNCSHNFWLFTASINVRSLRCDALTHVSSCSLSVLTYRNSRHNRMASHQCVSVCEPWCSPPESIEKDSADMGIALWLRGSAGVPKVVWQWLWWRGSRGRIGSWESQRRNSCSL